jgi:aldehyde:ferredoxin oxidoreductase
VLAIGQAGENRCRTATIGTGTGSAAGQCGFGAVMGAKRMKAIAVRGTRGIPIAFPEVFSDCTLAIARTAENEHPRGRKPKVDPLGRYGERIQACSQQCATSRCNLCRFYTGVPGIVHAERAYSGSVACVSKNFPGSPDSFYDWRIGWQAGFELAQISHDYGLNHWDMTIGLVPWLRRCHREGLLPDLDGVQFDLDSPGFWDALFHKITFREGIGDALAEGAPRAARILGLGEELLSESYAAWGFAGHWDGRGDWSNVIVFPYWLVTALQWATSTRDPLSSGHGYGQTVMMWSPMCLTPEDGLDWETLAAVGARAYGTPQAVHPLGGYEAKAFPAVWHGHRSVMKDSLTLDDQIYPRVYSSWTPDHFARADGMDGPSFEYHMFRLATGLDVSEGGFERMSERVFNLERAWQIRNCHRTRRVDETIVPYFEKAENWVNPMVGTRVALDRGKFAELMDEYYRLRGWDPEIGWPTPQKLVELDLADVAEDLLARGLAPAQASEAG